MRLRLGPLILVLGTVGLILYHLPINSLAFFIQIWASRDYLTVASVASRGIASAGNGIVASGGNGIDASGGNRPPGGADLQLSEAVQKVQQISQEVQQQSQERIKGKRERRRNFVLDHYVY